MTKEKIEQEYREKKREQRRTLLEFVDKGFSDALKKRLTRVSQEVIALRIKRDGAKDETDKKQS